MRKLAASLALTAGLALSPVHAATVTMLPHQLDDIGTVLISGELESRDDTRLAHLIAFHEIGRIVINSGGGDVKVAHAIAEMVRENKITVLVLQRNRCESACFIILAASPTKYAYTSSVIGVHRVHVGYLADMQMDSPEDTREVVELLRSYGVPEAILAKLAATSFRSMAVLSNAEMAAMGIRFKPESFFVIL